MTQIRWLLFGALAAASACTPFLGPLPPDGGDGSAAKWTDGGEDVPNETSRDGGAAGVGPEDRGDGGDASAQDSVAQEVAQETHGEVGSVPAVCGDGIPTLPEECDLGTAANTGAYGGCTKDCKLAPHCGDGKINDVSEICDDGENNGFGLGDCNPACSGVIAEKELRVARVSMQPGAIGGIADADAMCEGEAGPNYRALIVDGDSRVATKTPYAGDGQVDWVLSPYTRYVNASKNLIWATDDVALLGVRNGGLQPLLEPIVLAPNTNAWAGYERDWVASTDTCSKWQVADSQIYGSAVRLDTEGLDISTTVCSEALSIVCAERY